MLGMCFFFGGGSLYLPACSTRIWGKVLSYLCSVFFSWSAGDPAANSSLLLVQYGKSAKLQPRRCQMAIEAGPFLNQATNDCKSTKSSGPGWPERKREAGRKASTMKTKQINASKKTSDQNVKQSKQQTRHNIPSKPNQSQASTSETKARLTTKSKENQE